ncbi:hypothetical protein ACWGLP_15205 [Streptomyces lydicus]
MALDSEFIQTHETTSGGTTTNSAKLTGRAFTAAEAVVKLVPRAMADTE